MLVPHGHTLREQIAIVISRYMCAYVCVCVLRALLAHSWRGERGGSIAESFSFYSLNTHARTHRKLHCQPVVAAVPLKDAARG